MQNIVNDMDGPNIYLFKVNSRDKRRCEIYSKLIKTPEVDRSGVSIIKFEQIPHHIL